MEVWGERPCPEEARGPRLEPALDGGPLSEHLVAESATGPGWAQPKKALWHFSLPNPVDPPSAGETAGVGCAATWVAVLVTGLSDPDLGGRGWLWGCGISPLLRGKEPELVREVEHYRLDLVGLISTHSTGSGSKLLDRGWTLFFSGVAKGLRRQVGVGILTSPWLSAAVLEFTLVNERVASLHLRAGGETLTVVSAYAPNSSSEYASFLEVLAGGLCGLPGVFQWACRQWWRYLEGRDWEERLPLFEPEWCSIISVLYKTSVLVTACL